MRHIFNAGSSSDWPILVLLVVDGLRQPFDVVAHRMTVGEIAHALTYLEFKDARDRFNSEQTHGR